MNNETESKTLLDDFMREVANGDENTIDVSEKILDADGNDTGSTRTRTISLQNRALQPEQPVALPKCDSLRHSHAFGDPEVFAAFLEKFGEDPIVLADVDAVEIGAIVNSTAADGFEVVTMKPTLHPNLKRWARMFDQVHDARDFSTFIMRHRRQIVETDAREMAATFGQIRVARSITSDIGSGTNNTNGLVVQTKIQGKSREVDVELPETFYIDVPIFVGLDPVQLAVDIMTTATAAISPTEPGRVEITATCVDLDDAIIAAFETMLENVRTIEGATVGLGRLNFDTWDRLTN